MKIIAGLLFLLGIGALINPPVVSAQTETLEPAGPAAQTQAGQTGAISTEAVEDYTKYIRPLDKLRTELSQQQALLATAVDITTQISQLRNQETRSDILVLLDEDLSQTERVKAVLSGKNYAPSDELAAVRAEVELLKSMVIQTLQQASPPVIADAPAPWSLGPLSIQYVQAADREMEGFVLIATGPGNSVFLRLNESIKIAGKTILLDSVKPGSGGRVQIHFVVNGNLKTVYYPQ